MRSDRRYRAGIVRRSRHVGVAVLCGTTLVCIAMRRQIGRYSRTIHDRVARLLRDFPIDQVITEPSGHSFALTGHATIEISLTSAISMLLPPSEHPERRALVAEVLRRYPTLRRKSRLSRDRVVAIYALAIALTGATTTN